jgi:hypothetical protein
MPEPTTELRVTTKGGLAQLPVAAWLVTVGVAAASMLIVLAALLRSQAAIDALEESGAERIDSDAGLAAAASAEPTAAVVASSIPARLLDKVLGPSKASVSELDAARAGGPSELEALAQKYPADAAVLKALALAHARDKAGYVAAVGAVRRLLALEESAAGDPDVKQVLLLAASGPVDAATASLDVMGEAMGARGADLLYELLLAPSVGKFPKGRATTLLATADVKARATPALRIAYELRTTLPCKRKELLERATSDGDARALAYLKPLLATRGCGLFSRSDCYACLGSRSDVRAAIAAIEKR